MQRLTKLTTSFNSFNFNKGVKNMHTRGKHSACMCMSLFSSMLTKIGNIRVFLWLVVGKLLDLSHIG